MGGLFAGLKVEHLEIIKGLDPFWNEYQMTGDARKLGHSWADMMRAVFRPTASGAISRGRNREDLIDELFSRFSSRVASNPQKHEHYLAALVLVKS